jgi:hypothetical protein
MPGTQVVMGGNSIDTGLHSGARFDVGHWFNDERTLGVEAGYFFLAAVDKQQVAATTGLPGAPNLAIPYFDVVATGTTTGQPGETVFILPGPLAAGGVLFPGFAGVITSTLTNNVETADVNGMVNVVRGDRFQLDAVVGFRWLQFREDFTVTGSTVQLPGGPFGTPGSFFNVYDSFRARNAFYGGQVGGRAAVNYGRWSVQASSKVALGGVNQSLNVNGVSQTTGGNLFFSNSNITRAPFTGGVFAQPSNIGNHERGRFGAVFDETLNVGFRMSPRVSLVGGYNFLVASSVARPVDSLDRSINATQTGLASAVRAAGSAVPTIGSQAPLFAFHDSWLWAQGVTAGVELRY